MVQIHVGTDAGSEGKHVGDLLDSDGGAEPLRHLVAVDRRHRGRIQHRLDVHRASGTAQELHELIEGGRGRRVLAAPAPTRSAARRRMRWKCKTTFGRAALTSKPGGIVTSSDR